VVPTVVLVSFDTTRADAIGPVLRELEGARFELALAHAPTTLSSHTSMFSGLDPHGHGVVRNGFPVPDEVELLTTRYRDAGWDTLAVVGSLALESGMGLDRGFRVYEDFGWRRALAQVEQPASRVTERALELVDRRDSAVGLFLFVHYYDPHMPWKVEPEGQVTGDLEGITALTEARVAGTLSEATAAEARALYRREVAVADDALGALLAGLEARGLEPVVAVTADHGEMLEEHPTRPYGHGADVDLEVTHVPLVLVGLDREESVSRRVRLMDLGPTLLRVSGLEADLGEGGDLFAEGEAPPGFAEANQPHGQLAQEGWPNQPLDRSVVWKGHALERTPWSDEERFYHLDGGAPDEALRSQLEALLTAWDAKAPGSRQVEMSRETTEALQALGYLD